MAIEKNMLKSDKAVLMQFATLFKDSLLDEQAKKIKRLERNIAKLRKLVEAKNDVIEEVSKELAIKNEQLEDIRKKICGQGCNPNKYVGREERGDRCRDIILNEVYGILF